MMKLPQAGSVADCALRIVIWADAMEKKTLGTEQG